MTCKRWEPFPASTQRKLFPEIHGNSCLELLRKSKLSTAVRLAVKVIDPGIFPSTPIYLYRLTHKIPARV